ncbi:MAG: hypothetical protein JNM99_01535 [Verrucomicrobiaceae bacterium]|nr:hypothetical protein [Verrucomicrobiaceae bacterium]
MKSSAPISRRVRRHRTHAVLSDLADSGRWWDESTAVKVKSLSSAQVRFRNMDPFERFHWMRYIVVGLSIVSPLVILVHGVRSQNHRPVIDWETSPLVEARRCVEDGRAREALPSLRAAVNLSPDKPDLIRALATVGAEASPAEARRCFHKLEQLKLATVEDRASHAMLLAKLHDFNGAKAVLGRLASGDMASSVAQKAWLTVWREAGDFPAAAKSLKTLVAAAPDEVDASLDLATAMVGTTATQEVVQVVQQTLLNGLSRWMNQGRGGDVLERARRLMALPFSGSQCRAQAAQILRNLPGQPAEFRLAAVRLGFPADLELTDEDLLRKAYMDEIAWNGELSAEAKDSVAGYFQQQREHGLVVELIARPEALTETMLFQRRLSSLLELGNWREAGAMAAAVDAPRPTHSRAVLGAMAVLQDPAGRSFMAERLLLDALAGAREERRAVDCFATGCVALDHSLENLASTAFAMALDFSSDRRTTMDSIMRKARGNPMPVATFLRALEGSAALRDESVQSQLIYLSLLAGRQIDAMRDVIQARRQQTPSDTYLRFLDAFALHQQGKFTQAAQQLVPLPKYRWHQGEAAVIASIVAAAGNFDRSSALLGQIDDSLLFAEERLLVEPWHQRLNDGANILSTAMNRLEK